jgi:hypothetical protein
MGRTDEQLAAHRAATKRYRRQQRRKGISPHGRRYKRHPAHPIIIDMLEAGHPDLYAQLMGAALDRLDEQDGID